MKLADHPTVKACKEERIDSPRPPAILESARLKQWPWRLERMIPDLSIFLGKPWRNTDKTFLMPCLTLKA